MYKLCFFVPESHLESTKAAVFAAGAGRIGAYDQCCWQVKGLGQFCPLPGSNPFVGRVGGLETVEEFRVEMVCSDERIAAAIAALKRAHPYEEPAYDVWRLAEM
jgi:hypothetical protein